MKQMNAAIYVVSQPVLYETWEENPEPMLWSILHSEGDPDPVSYKVT